MNEHTFEVWEAEEGGYNAHAFGHSIFTWGESMETGKNREPRIALPDS
jgi:hypothetical protein